MFNKNIIIVIAGVILLTDTNVHSQEYLKKDVYFDVLQMSKTCIDENVNIACAASFGNQEAFSILTELVALNQIIIDTSRSNGASNIASEEVNQIVATSAEHENARSFLRTATFMSMISSLTEESTNEITESETPQSVCGYFDNPLPRTAAQWNFYNEIEDPESILRGMGFHEVPWILPYGGGWTRPHTYRSDMCNTGSFRDHGYVYEDDVSPLKSYGTQIYTGFIPNGEPNPELDTYDDPYLLWPVYAWWWHRNH